MEKTNKLVVVLAVFAMVLYPLNDLACIITALLATVLAVFVLKDKTTTSKVLQPTLVLGGVYVFRAILLFIVNIINNFARLSDTYYSSSIYENTTQFNYILNALCYIFVFVMLAITIVMFCLKKDVFVVNKFANKFAGIEKDKQQKQVENQTKNNDNKANDK